jgi:cell wall-associated NlpC family hydrolase
MLCSDKTNFSVYNFFRPSFSSIISLVCSLALLCAMNSGFAVTKKHVALHKNLKHAVTAKINNHPASRHKKIIALKSKTKSHHLAHKKNKHLSDDQKNIASVISISYDGSTLIANVNKETPIKTANINHKILPVAQATKATAEKKPVETDAQNDTSKEGTGLFDTIANAINFTPSRISDTPDDADAEKPESVLKPISAPAYLTKSPEVVPAVEHTSFAASLEKHLVNFVHKTVATLRYSDYKLGGRKFDTSRGVYIVDCSSFVDHILQRVSPRAYLSLVNATGADTPATQHYYEFFTELSSGPDNFWNKVEAVEQLRPGDILVFRYKNSRGSETGGHVMVVMDKPTQDSDVFFVRVADSAPSRHSQDTRQRNEAGIGIGTLVLKVNPRTGRPAAYAWGLGGLWNKNVNFAMARPIDTPERG